MNIDLLEDIGFTKSEIKVYLALLELGSSTTGPIVDKAKIASSKVYEILDKLIEKGLASYIISAGTKHFEAAPPKRLKDYMEEKKSKLKQQEQKLDSLLPELELKQTLSKYKSDATIYKGKKGLETALQDVLKTLKKGETHYAFTVGILDDWTNNFFNHHYRLRAKKGIKNKTIFSEAGRENYESRKGTPFFEGKVIGQATSPATVNIYGNKVNLRMGLSNESICIIINNKELAESFLAQFNTLWNQDTSIGKGFEYFENMIKGIHDKGKPYAVLGAGVAQRKYAKLYEKFFDDISTHRIENKIEAKLLFEQNSKKVVEKFNRNYNSYAEVKYLPYEQESPVEIFIEEDKAHITIQEKEPTVITINNKVIAESFQKQFDSLWDQDTVVSKGWDSFLNTLNEFVDEIEPGDTFDALGTGFGVKGSENRYAKEFTKFHKHRLEKGIQARWLFQQGNKEIISSNQDNFKEGTIKYLPYKTESPVGIHPYKDKTLIIIQGKEPTIITINSKEVTESFQKSFQAQWDQETRIVKGLDAIQDLFEEMLEHGHVDLIGARGYFMDERREWIDKVWKPKAIKKGFTMRNLVDPGTYGHYITKLPFAETRYGLPKEFSPLSVFWIIKNKVAISNWVGKEPVVTIIENKQFYEIYKKQFESLWNQEVQTYEGLKGMEVAFQEALDATPKGSETYVYGAGANPKETDEILYQYNQARSKKGVKLKIIFSPSAKKSKINRDTLPEHNPLAEIKFSNLPETPASYEIYPDRVIIKTATKKDPRTVVIKNKSFVETSVKNFNELWNQKTFTYEGEEGVRLIFDDALYHKDLWAIGGNDGIKKYFPEYWKEWDQKRIKNKVMFHDLIDTKLLEKLYDRNQKIPYYEFKVLSKELNSPHVIWIWGDNVANIIWDKKTIITVTKDKKIAESYKNYFNYLWKTRK